MKLALSHSLSQLNGRNKKGKIDREERGEGERDRERERERERGKRLKDNS